MLIWLLMLESWYKGNATSHPSAVHWRFKKQRWQWVTFSSWDQCFEFPAVFWDCWLGAFGLQKFCSKSSLTEKNGGRKTRRQLAEPGSLGNKSSKRCLCVTYTVWLMMTDKMPSQVLNLATYERIQFQPKFLWRQLQHITGHLGLSIRSFENCSSHRRLDDDGSTSA